MLLECFEYVETAKHVLAKPGRMEGKTKGGGIGVVVVRARVLNAVSKRGRVRRNSPKKYVHAWTP